MSQADDIRHAFRDEPALSRREKRALRTRSRALSPARILLSLLMVPIVTVGLTVSIYLRAGPFERENALRHLIALAGCGAAAKLGMFHIQEGEPGYHARNDPDGDGVACDSGGYVGTVPPAPVQSASGGPSQTAGGAKFLRP